MKIELWITIISDIICAVIGGVFGVLAKSYSIKKKNKNKLKQKSGNNSIQIQIGGDYNAK